jgi:hypothetical protein
MDTPQRSHYEFDGPYIDSPVWPWATAGWTLAAGLVLFTLLAWLLS